MHVGKGVQEFKEFKEWRAAGRKSRRAEGVASRIDRIAPDLSRSVGMAAIASLSKCTVAFWQTLSAAIFTPGPNPARFSRANKLNPRRAETRRHFALARPGYISRDVRGLAAT